MLSLTHLGIEIALVAAECAQPKWDGKNALPVGRQQWVDAWNFAEALALIEPSLPQPIPGGEIDGSVWLTYERGVDRFALNIRSDMTKKLLGWHAIHEGSEQHHECDADRDHSKPKAPIIVPRDVVESLRATFKRDVTHAA